MNVFTFSQLTRNAISLKINVSAVNIYNLMTNGCEVVSDLFLKLERQKCNKNGLRRLRRGCFVLFSFEINIKAFYHAPFFIS